MVNDTSSEDESALDLAVENKKKDVIELLLEKGTANTRTLNI